MTRVIVGFALIMGVLLALGVNVSGLIGPLTALLILGAGLHLIVRGKLPQHFLLILVCLVAGPAFFSFLLRFLAQSLSTLVAENPGSSLVILACLMTLSFFYVSKRVSFLRPDLKPATLTNERQPVLPVIAGESEGQQCAESDLCNDSLEERSTVTPTKP